MQTVSVSISRVTQARLRYTLYIDCISISFVVLHSPSSATRCMQTASVLSCHTGPAPLHAVCKIHQFGRVSQARLRYTLYVDCISFVVLQTPSSATSCIQTASVLSCFIGPAPLHAVCRLYQYLSVAFHRPNSATRCMQTVSVSISRVKQAQVRYTLYIDCISISFYVLHSLSSATRFMQTASVLSRYRGPAPLRAVCRLHQFCRVSQARLLYTLYVDCISIYLSRFIGPAPLHAVYRLYQYLSVVNSFSSATRCIQSVSVSISRVTQAQLRYRLFIDCISIYLSSTSPAPLYAVCRLYQYLSVVNSPSSAIRCMQTESVSMTAPAPLYAVY